MTVYFLETHQLVDPFMRGSTFRYDYHPNPTGHRSFIAITILNWRLAEFCSLISGLIPGFDLKLSHIGVQAHDQYIFKTYGLRMNQNGTFSLIPEVASSVRFPVFAQIKPNVFDLA